MAESEDDILFEQGPEAYIRHLEEKAKTCPHPEGQKMNVLPRGGDGTAYITCKACWSQWAMAPEQQRAWENDIRASLQPKARRKKHG